MMGDFYGLKTGSISNGLLVLDYLLEAGPRIVNLRLEGKQGNLLAEVPDISWPTPYGPFYLRGGHRLWHAPEVARRTYVPDNQPVTVEPLEHGVRLVGPEEPITGIRKQIEIRLHPGQTKLTLDHSLMNEGLWPVELAPWAITALPLGGTAILPQPTEALDADGLLPNRHLVLWPYTHWGDERLQLRDGFVLIEGHPHPDPLKVGLLNYEGWAAYLHEDLLFCKRFNVQPDAHHPDRNSNVEVYTRDRFLELETLAPLVELAPGETTTHQEQWEIRVGIEPDQQLADLAALLAP